MSGEEEVEEFLSQNPQVREWVESLRGICETTKQWNARRTFILRNMELLGPEPKPGFIPEPGPKLDQLLAQSMVWSNHIFMGCRYPDSVMERALKMGEGITVQDPPQFTTRDQLLSRSKKTTPPATDADSSVKRSKHEPSSATTAFTQKSGPSPQAPVQLQPFFNRLYKTVCWRLVTAGGPVPGPNLDHYEVLRSCVESCKEVLGLVLVPLKEITGLPPTRTQKEGHVCELRCRGVYLGTGYGRDEVAARAMASKEALRVFQGRKVLVKICRRKFKGQDVDDLMLLDDQPRSQGFPPALSYPFSPEYRDESGS